MNFSRKQAGFTVVAVFVFVMAVNTVKQVVRQQKLNYELALKREKVVELEKISGDLARRLEEVNKPEYVTKEIREKLGLGKPGEVLLVETNGDTDGRGSTLAYQGVADGTKTPNWEKWWRLVARTGDGH